MIHPSTCVNQQYFGEKNISNLTVVKFNYSFCHLFKNFPVHKNQNLTDDVEATSFASAATDDELLVDDLSRKSVEVRNGVHRLSKTFSTACQIIVDLFSVKFFDDEDDANFAAKFNHPDDLVIGELKEIF